MNNYRRQKCAAWGDIPNVDWPPNLPKPTVEEVAKAALDATGARDITDMRLAGSLCRVAMYPWLVTHTRLSSQEIAQAVGYSRCVRRQDQWVVVMLAPVGRAIAQAMGCRLREIVRERMEQTQ